MRGVISLLILVAAIGGISVFSVFAHDKVESSNNAELVAQNDRLTQHNERLVNQVQGLGKRNASDRSQLQESLFIAFPNEQDRERITAALNAAYGEPEEDETEEVQTETTEEVESE